jgi:hypothetical protein
MKLKFFFDLLKKIKFSLSYIIEEIEDAWLLKMMKEVDRNEKVSYQEVIKKLNS